MMQTNTARSPEYDMPLERFVELGGHEVDFYYKNDSLYITHQEQLKPYPKKLSDCLIKFATTQPDKVFVAKKNDQSEWVKLTYAEVLERAWHIAQALHDRPLSAERPLVILSGNDLEHLLLSMGAMLAGVPYAPISPAYSLISTDYAKLKHVFDVLTPGMVYANDGDAFANAINHCVNSDIEVATNSGFFGETSCTPFQQLLDAPVVNVQEHYETIDENQIVKFLFTSGSTKLPKAVPTTHLMICINQAMSLHTFPEFETSPPVVMDWLSWHHTFGGTHNVGIALFNGGTIYIDEGKPVPGKFDTTIQNLKEVSPTIYLNVPKGWEELTNALEKDEELRNSFYKKIKVLYFAGAALSDEIWKRLDNIALQHCGEKIRIMAGLGMTETAPSCLFSTGPTVFAGFVGYPAPGCEVKLVPHGDKLEFCVRGKHVMKGYWRLPEDQQTNIFDDEGFFHTGDAVRLVDSNDPKKGMIYDGRISEDFKLNTGTFVNSGAIKNKVLVQGNQLIQDVCITGSNLNAIGLLVFPKIDACAQLANLDMNQSSITEILSHPNVTNWFKNFLIECNKDATGSANTVAMLYLMQDAPNLALGEITDKGNLNQSNIQKFRADKISELYQKHTDNPLIVKMPTSE